MKNLTQLKALIKNVAKQKDINAQILLRNYMLERLLERIALSEFKDKFILKGGMLVAALVGVGNAFNNRYGCDCQILSRNKRIY